MKQTATIIFLALTLLSKISAKEWYETAAFYQIYPQSFYDGGGGSAGTGSFKGIEAKLDYIKDLGFDCLWLTPIFQSSFNAFGYDITNYTDIDTRYGSRKDFENLINAVHGKGMKIIVDFVPNHCGEAHEFFQKSIQKVDGYADWFLWSNALNFEIDNAQKAKPTNWQAIGDAPGSGWTKPEGRDEFYYAQFHPNMPDFNLRNPKVLDYFEYVMKYWLDLNLDGFRIDAISHGVEAEKNATGFYPNEERNSPVTDEKSFDYLIHSHTQDQPELFEIIYRWRKFLNDYRTNNSGDERIIMTESYSPVDVIKKYYVSDDGRNGSHLPFNFQMINVININSTAADFVSMVTDWLKVIPEGKVTNWVIGNHDQRRVASRFGEERVDMLNTLVTMLPGTSVTYYGEEIGMSDSCAKFSNDHNQPAEKCDPKTTQHQSDWVRSPMQWSDEKNAGFSTADVTWIPVAENYKTINVKAQENKTNSHLEIHRQLLKLRKNEAITDSDKFEIKTLNLNSFAFKRELEDKKKKSIIVIINFGNVTEKVDISKSMPDIPEHVTVEITGGKSQFKKGQELSTSEFDLNEFESIVAFYNSAVTRFVSKTVVVLIVAFRFLSV